MIRYLKQAFRTNTVLSSSANIQDFAITSANNQSVRSAGATLLDSTALTGGSPTKLARVQSVAIRCYLMFIDDSGAAPGRSDYFGQLGALIGGMFATDSPSFTQGGPTPWEHSLLALPSDPTLATDIWNPATDPLPPLINVNDEFGRSLNPTPGQTLPVSGVISPPLPIDVPIGSQIAVGLWWLPSLIGCKTLSTGGLLELTAFNSSYTIVYDDGS